MIKKMLLFVIIPVLSGITQTLCADELETFLKQFGEIELGKTLKEFTQQFPNAQSMELPKNDSSLADVLIYKCSVDFPLSQTVIFRFQQEKLVGINCMDPDRLFSSSWEGADALVRWGKEAVHGMEKLWGVPTSAKTKLSENGSQQVYLKWELSKTAIVAAFTAPASLLKQSGTDQNLNGMFMLWKTAPDSQDAVLPPDLNSEYKPALLEADYETFRKRMEVTPVPDSAKLFPSEIQNVYIGMETSELRKKRPKIKADDFFNESWNFYEYLENATFYSVNYRARMDRLVKVSLIPPRDRYGDPEKLKPIVAEILKQWGNPAELLIPQKPESLSGEYESYIYIWNSENAKTAMKIDVTPKPFAQVMIMEKKLPLTCVVPDQFSFSQKPLSADDLNALKACKFWK